MLEIISEEHMLLISRILTITTMVKTQMLRDLIRWYPKQIERAGQPQALFAYSGGPSVAPRGPLSTPRVGRQAGVHPESVELLTSEIWEWDNLQPKYRPLRQNGAAYGR